VTRRGTACSVLESNLPARERLSGVGQVVAQRGCRCVRVQIGLSLLSLRHAWVRRLDAVVCPRFFSAPARLYSDASPTLGRGQLAVVRVGGISDR